RTAAEAARLFLHGLSERQRASGQRRRGGSHRGGQPAATEFAAPAEGVAAGSAAAGLGKPARHRRPTPAPPCMAVTVAGGGARPWVGGAASVLAGRSGFRWRFRWRCGCPSI